MLYMSKLSHDVFESCTRLGSIPIVLLQNHQTSNPLEFCHASILTQNLCHCHQINVVLFYSQIFLPILKSRSYYCPIKKFPFCSVKHINARELVRQPLFQPPLICILLIDQIKFIYFLTQNPCCCFSSLVREQRYKNNEMVSNNYSPTTFNFDVRTY